MTTTPLHLRARAKINLYLHVVGRRADGYHLLDSLVVFADLGDELKAVPAAAGALSLAVEGPFAAGLSTGEDNLVLRAARALADALRERGLAAGGARLALVKNLPVASGIGGGSADAAATLIALTRLWQVPEGAVDLAAIGLSLGADLPVCLAGAPRFVGGIGERLDPVPALPTAALLLVNPGVAVSTPAVFKMRQGAFSAPARWSDALPDAAALAARLARCRNDLEASAMAIAPVIGEVLMALERLPGALLTRMSGSGATCFALFADIDHAEMAAARLRRERPRWWIAAAPMLAAAATG
ncbi:MAG: 4-(cytidine 5'-diphospho)-2-C-methyl-D-erythritol kinase [Pseudomonadota bacterium]